MLTTRTLFDCSRHERAGSTRFRRKSYQLLDQGWGVLALPLLELKPTPRNPLGLMHFYSGLLMYFYSGVDTGMVLDDKALDTFEIITRAFDEVESDLKGARESGELDEKQYYASLAALLTQRMQKLCDEVPGFREEFNRLASKSE